MTEKLLKCFLLSCMIIFGQAGKIIIFTKLQCAVKSNAVAKVNCYLENNSLNLDVTLSNIQMNNLVGISQLHLFVYGRKNVMRLNNIRLDICQMLASTHKTSLITMLYRGIKQTDNNLPNKCPFQKNTTYNLHNMKFDATYLPSYLPEYNFTYTGRFHGNNVDNFEVRVIGSFCDLNHDCTGLVGANKTVALKITKPK